MKSGKGEAMFGRRRSWREVLQACGDECDGMLARGFLTQHGAQPWRPNDADRAAAASLHIELTSRIATRQLGYSEGVEGATLASLHALFERARAICERNLAATAFETIVWHVLNTHLRPFVAHWHRRHEVGELRALDQTDEFRSQLTGVQAKLRHLDRVMLVIRDGEGAAPTPADTPPSPLDAELAAAFSWGLAAQEDGEEASAQVSARDEAEKAAIVSRRTHYGIRTDRAAVGLALSGGGIRSATFSLGVLMALARRGVLDQVDYLSTVSGGGYLGSFLINYLAGDAPPGCDPIGLRPREQPFGELDRHSPAIGHIRQSSRYLASRPSLDRVQLALMQVGGLLINLILLAAAVALAGLTFAAVADGLTSASAWVARWLGPDGPGQPAGLSPRSVALALLAFGLVIAPLCASRGPRWERFASWGLGFAALPLTGVICDTMLRAVGQVWRDSISTDPTRVAATLLAPVAVLTAGVIGERLLPAGKSLARLITMVAAPLFLLLIFLAASTGLAGAGLASPAIVLGATGVLVLFGASLNLNFTGLHRVYRDRLAAAFLVRASAGPSGIEHYARTRLSELADRVRAPYLIINCALNVPASTDPRMRGRLTDFFSITPHFCGSPLTGYHSTVAWEERNPAFGLATAMAVSGAAVSPQMGLQTKRPVSFWLALLNARLDWWIKRPDRRRALGPCGDYLARSLIGKINEKTAYLNLSDGGHIENLGLYELLRRRCKFVIAIDGEQDEKMTFQGMANLQRLASIDLGTSIDINLDDLRRSPDGLSRSHFQFSRIRYPNGATGYLLYLKLSLTGNEGEFLRRFQLDEPDFPHHPTLDQNFTEIRFEAYRSLGQHVGDKLFLPSIVGRLSTAERVDVPEWFGAIARSLLAQPT
jgi:hypothetical protein